MSGEDRRLACAHAQADAINPAFKGVAVKAGLWTLDSGLDHGLDRGLDVGLDFGPKFGPSFGLASINRLFRLARRCQSMV